MGTDVMPGRPQVDGAGRGVFAERDIRFGAVVHTERPMLCHPAPQQLGKVG